MEIELDILSSEMHEILGFPKIDRKFSGHTLFLRGENSEYIRAEHREVINSLFKKARFATLKDAGHGFMLKNHVNLKMRQDFFTE